MKRRAEEEEPKKEKGTVASFVDDEAASSGMSEGEMIDFTDEEEEVEKYERKGKRKPKRNRFIDMEAEVGDEDDDEEDEDDDGGYGEDEDELSEEDLPRPEDYIRRLPPRKEQAAAQEDFDPEAEEARLRALYGRAGARGEEGEMGGARMQRSAMLLPKATDPKLWLVKCRPGKERDAVALLCRGLLELDSQGQSLPPVFSAVSRDTLKGYVYVEAYKPADITAAIQRLRLTHLIFASQWTRPSLVPMAEMADVLSVVAKPSTTTQSIDVVTPGGWVRVKRGKYSGDLAQVLEAPEEPGTGALVRIRLLPRLSYRRAAAATAASRPPARPFDPQEAAQYGSVTKARGYWQFGQELYSKEGFLVKEVRLSSLQTTAVQPRPEELERFGESSSSSALEEKGEGPLLLSKGDRVLVKEGDLKGVEGRVEAVQPGSEWVSVRLEHPDLAQQLVTLKPSQLRKHFVIGDAVRMARGPHVGKTGMVVATDGSSITVLAAGHGSQFNADAADATESTATTAVTQMTTMSQEMAFDLNDLVQNMDGSVYGLVTRIFPEERQLTIVDQAGTDRTLPVSDLRKIDTRALASAGAPSDPSVFKAGDRVQIDSAAGQATRPATILQAYRTLAWVKTLDTQEVLTRRFTAIHRPTPYGQQPVQSPMRQGGGGGGGRHLLGKSVTIAGGVYKGYAGIVKDVYDSVVRVELHTNSKVVEVARDRIVPVGGSSGGEQQQQHQGRSDSWGGKTPAWGTAKTPAWGTSKTPAWNAASGKTPAWNAASGKTPAWNAASGKTPAWNAASGKTPAWNAASGKTPAWNAASGKTPAWNAQSGKTPSWNAPSGKTPAWNTTEGRTPAWNAGGKTPLWTSAATTAGPAAVGAPTWNAAPTPAWSSAVPSAEPSSTSDVPLWAQEGILVRLKGSSDSRVVRSSLPGKIILADDQSYRPSDLEPVPPAKKDRVRVLTSEAGTGPATGTVIGMDGPDAVVRLDETSAFRIVPIHHLGRLADR